MKGLKHEGFQVTGAQTLRQNEGDRTELRSRDVAPIRDQPWIDKKRGDASTELASADADVSREIHRVRAGSILETDRDADIRRSGEETTGTLVATVRRPTAEVRRAVVSESPVRIRAGDGTTGIERLQGLVAVSVLRELQAREVRGPDVAETGIDEEREIEQRELPAERREVRSLRDGLEVGFEPQAATEGAMPEHGGLDGTNIVHVHDGAGREPEHRGRDVTRIAAPGRSEGENGPMGMRKGHRNSEKQRVVAAQICSILARKSILSANIGKSISKAALLGRFDNDRKLRLKSGWEHDGNLDGAKVFDCIHLEILAWDFESELL